MNQRVSPLYLMCVLLTDVPVSVCGVSTAKTVETLAWRSPMSEDKWPELERENIATKPSVGLAFSGGGSRSFIASLGYLRGLVDLGLLNKARYITGVSGGSWAVSTLAYYKRGGTGQAKSDAELLGDVVAPESITWQGLLEMPNTCARKVVQKSIYAAALKLYLEPNYPRDTVWQETIQEIFMEPVGITSNPFSLDRASVSALKARNPALRNTTFITTNDVDHPYPIIPVTVLGPTKLIPYEERNRTYTHLEMTPLYVGEPCEKQVTFCSKKGVETHLLGGLIEPFAFKSQPPAQGLAPGAASGSLQVEMAKSLLRVADMAAASGWAPGDTIDSPGIVDLVGDLEPHAEYWSPNVPGAPPLADMLLADGGILENTGLMGLLRRKVRSVVVFLNTVIPLRPKYNACSSEAPGVNDIESQLAAWFGWQEYPSDESGFYYYNDHIFNQTDYCPFVKKIQAAQASGKGAVASMELTTIENQWWNISAGMKVNMTLAYLSRTFGWEDKLKDSRVKWNALPLFNRDDPTSIPSSGPFKGFPHYSTFGDLEMEANQANLLADLTGWVVKNNAEIFSQAFGEHAG